MLPAIVKLLLTAVDGEPGVNATVWSVDAPEQFAFVNLWNVTLPVGSGTAAGVPASRFTYALSWTTRPPVPLVTTWLLELRMSVVTASSAHSFVALPLSPTFESPVSRFSTTPPTVTAVAAFTTVVPGVAVVSVIVQLPVPPAVVQGLAVVKPPGPLTIENVICVPSGAFT